jgi:hypothetical protein
MLGLEVFQIILVGFVLRCLLVLGQLRIVPLLCPIGLSFAGFSLLGR